MIRPHIKAERSGVKAVHRYEVVDGISKLRVAETRFHFIGVGGIGMSGLAQLLMKNGAIVTGSDQRESAIITKLSRSRADIKIGHRRENLSSETTAVVVSAAIKDDNPELKLARQRGLRIFKYAQMLGLLMNRYKGIAVAGTHGKSTTSGWLSYILKKADVDVSFIVGAEVTQLGSSSGTGDSEFFIAEACEYDRSFLNLRPKIACVLNIEQDHLDYYKNEDEIVAAFGEFALGVEPDGMVIANGHDTNVDKIIDLLPAELRCETFGLDAGCNIHAGNVRLLNGFYAFDVYHNGKFLGPAMISLPGRHNILNALAVTAMAINLGIPAKRVLQLLPGFTGIDRRLMLKGELAGITILDDYAHHPTEIRATLEAIRERYRPDRIWCVFQPHQYSRTRFLLDDFAESFKLAEVTIVPEIYFIRDSEASRKEINAQTLVERICDKRSNALFIDSFGAICNYLQENVTAGDLVVTMGAGDVWKIADEFIQRLRKDS